MTIDLTAYSVSALRDLRRALADGRVSGPLDLVNLGASHLAVFAPLAAATAPLSTAAWLAIVDAVLAERGARPPPSELVWSGPETPVATTRDTAVVLRELFARARHSVLVAGYAFREGRDIFAALHAGMLAHRVRAAFFVNVDVDGLHRTAAELAVIPTPELADLALRRTFDHNWPFGDPWPEIYYDPRSATARAPSSLHAKCVVVDDEVSLVGSANFTDRGQARNYEAGVLLHEPAFARRLVGQWWSLVEAGRLTRWRP